MSFKKEDKKLLFGQPKDHTVIDEHLIEESLREVGEGGTAFNEIKTLSLSYKSMSWNSIFLPQTVTHARHLDHSEPRRFGPSREVAAG